MPDGEMSPHRRNSRLARIGPALPAALAANHRHLPANLLIAEMLPRARGD